MSISRIIKGAPRALHYEINENSRTESENQWEGKIKE
jgi:hypothetical protein